MLRRSIPGVGGTCPSADRREKGISLHDSDGGHYYNRSLHVRHPSNGKGCSCMYYYIYYKTYNIRYIHGSGTF